jgi:hypothetical protein
MISEALALNVPTGHVEGRMRIFETEEAKVWGVEIMIGIDQSLRDAVLDRLGIDIPPSIKSLRIINLKPEEEIHHEQRLLPSSQAGDFMNMNYLPNNIRWFREFARTINEIKRRSLLSEDQIESLIVKANMLNVDSSEASFEELEAELDSVMIDKQVVLKMIQPPRMKEFKQANSRLDRLVDKIFLPIAKVKEGPNANALLRTKPGATELCFVLGHGGTNPARIGEQMALPIHTEYTLAEDATKIYGRSRSEKRKDELDPTLQREERFTTGNRIQVQDLINLFERTGEVEKSAALIFINCLSESVELTSRTIPILWSTGFASITKLKDGSTYMKSYLPSNE